MSDDFLKGNFKVKKEIKEEKASQDDQKKDGKALSEELKKMVMSSIGGSMVYMERTDLTWDGDESDDNS